MAGGIVASLVESSRAGRFDVILDGEVIVKGGRDPEHEACRVLLARGVTGRITFVHRDGMAGMRMDIAKGAGRSVDDSTSDGRPRVRRWKAFPGVEGSPQTRTEALDGEMYPNEANARL